MPLFSDLSNISHYYSGGSSSLNYFAGPYAGHSSIVAANYRAPPPSFSKPTTRIYNRGYKPHLATISENQMSRSGLSRINSPKMLYHSSPKYKFQKPISINTADIDVSSNRYNKRYEKPKVSSPRSSTTARPKTPERTPSFKEATDEEDPEGIFMPRIDKNFRSTIKRERTVVRLHTIHNLDQILDDKTLADESPPKRERRLVVDDDKKIETVKIFDEEIKKTVPKWRENFEPDELKPNSRRRVVQKPLSEKYVEKFLIKDKQEEFEDLSKVIRDDEDIKLLEQEIEEQVAPTISRRNSVKPSFHEICKTISSEKIDEDLNPGSNQIVRRNTRKMSNYDVMKAIRRNSAEVNGEEIKMLDELIKEEKLDTKINAETPKPETEPQEETDVKKRKKFTKKKSNEKLVDDEPKEEKTTPQRRKIVKKKTTGSLDKAIEAITPKDSKTNEEVKKVIPKISGTVEIENKPNLKLVIDTIHVEETIKSSSSPTSKKFKYNVIVEEVVTPHIEKKELKFDSKVEVKNERDDKKITSKLKIEEKIQSPVDKAEQEKQKMLDKILGKQIEETPKQELNKMFDRQQNKKESTTDYSMKTDKQKQQTLDNILYKKSEDISKAEEEKQKMLDKIMGKSVQDTKAEEEKQKMLDKIMGKTVQDTKAEEEKQKMLDKIMGKSVQDTKAVEDKQKITKKDEIDKKAEDEKNKMLDKLLGKKDTKAEEEKQKMLDKIMGKKDDVDKKAENEKLLGKDKKAEEEKQKMLDKIMGKKDDVDKKAENEKLLGKDKKAEEEKQKMLDKIMGKKDDVDKKAENENLLGKDKKAEEEKQKMLDKIMGKKDDVDKKVENDKILEKDKKAEEEKQKMLDKIMGKKVEDKVVNNKLADKIAPKLEESKLPKQIEQKNKINEIQNKSNSKLNFLSKVQPKKEPIAELTKSPSGAKKHPLQKQDSVEDFWEVIGKRETIYYKNRAKYLEEKRETEKKNTCWTPDWVDENQNEHPYAFDAEILEKSRASDARLRQKLAEMETVDSIDKTDETIKQEKRKTDNDIFQQKQAENSAKIKALQETIAQKKLIIAEKTKAIQPKVTDVEQGNKMQAVKKEGPKKLEVTKVEQKLEVTPKKLEVTKIEKKPEPIPKKTEIVVQKKPEPESPPKKLDAKKAELQKSKTTEVTPKPKDAKPQQSKTSSNLASKQKVQKTETPPPETKQRPPKLSVKQKSFEKVEVKIRPRLQRQSKSLDHPQKEKIKLTPLEIAEMKAVVRDLKIEPLKPELDFIIKEEFDPCLKPNEDLLVPTPSVYKKIKPQLDERDRKKRGESPPKEEEPKKDDFVPLQTNFLALPDAKPKPKPKPKWFDECPVVIMATPRDLRKRNPVHRRKNEPTPAPKVTYVSDSDEDETSSDEESTTSSSSSGGSDEFETNIVFDANNPAANKWKSTSSNDSGFDSSAPGSPANKRNRNDDCDVNCHKKCEKLTANLCGVNQKLIVEALTSVKKGSTSVSTSSSDTPTLSPAQNPAFTLEPMEMSSAYSAYQRSGRVTPPATSIPRFRKYAVEDFVFLKVLGKGSFGKVLLAELRNTEYYYAVKCLKKDIVLEDDDVECTLIERKVLALGTKHPYLCHLFCTFQTDSHLFFVMEYLNGGDLMFHIQVSGRFPEPRGKFYGAEIVSGLKFLHSKGIVYRDLKLDNILLDFDGHVRIADFGMCKLQIFLDRTADTFCGTPDYMAPEIIKGQHYNQGVDWWSFGVLLYEMLIGQSPFSGCDEDELFWSICNERPVIPAFLSKEASQILLLLLEKDSSKRLGNKYCAAGDIKDQPFFRDIDWVQLEARQLEAPFKPKVQHPLDTQYFDKAFTAEKVKLTPVEKDILHSMDQTQFHGFSYTNPNATDK